MSLHDSLTVIDGLVISNWSRDVFEDMRAGGITAANCTCAVWEGFQGTMDNIAGWNRWFRDHGDLITLVRTTEDIGRAKRDGKTGIILGWQNASPIEDKLEYLELFHTVGVRVIQLAYNTQNLVGTGCYERDGGLSDYGRDVIDEMNRLGMLVDLSHVGPQTSDDAIKHSKQRVCYSHTCPQALKDHPRNKTDEQLKTIADHNGFVGVTMFPPFLPRGAESDLGDYLTAIEHTINVCGEDAVGIGTDLTQGHDQAFFDWITHDKGFGRKLIDFGPIKNPPGFQRLGEFPNLTAAMEARGWSHDRIERIIGGNWVQLYRDVWGA